MTDAGTTEARNEALWEAMARAGALAGEPDAGSIDVAALLRDAARHRRLPDEAVLEKLERKAAIARRILPRYAAGWKAAPEVGTAPMDTLAGVAAMLLLDAASAQDRARALKRLNGAWWVLESRDWQGDAPGARSIAEAAEQVARGILGSAA